MDRFKAVESFIAVAKCGSYSRAAKQFGVSRSVVSRRIMELEARLGARLFNRNTRRLSLTEAGLSFFSSCEGLLSDLEAAEQSVIEGRKVARGTLRILTSQTFGYVHLGAAAAAFMRRYPDIETFVMARDLSLQAMDLIGGGFDLAIRTVELTDSSLVARKIVPLNWFVVAAPAYLERRGIPRAPQELASHTCLVTGSEPAHRWMLESAAGSETVKITGLPVSNLTTATQDAVREGLGIALLPEYCVAPELASGTLVRLLPDYKARQRWLYAVYPRDRVQPPKIRLFIDFLAARFKNASWGREAVELSA